MKLVNLHPAWTSAGFGGTARPRAGIYFDCPGLCCSGTGSPQRIHVPFRNPDDDGPEIAGEPRWQRIGTTFETLTLTPSVDASKFGHWHGFVTAGETVG